MTLPVPEPFAHRCWSCGYRLQGLAAEGICPECGQPYRPDQIVLSGWGAGQMETLTTARPGRRTWIASSSAFLIMTIVLFQLRGAHRLSTLLWLATMALVLGQQFYRRRKLQSEFDMPANVMLSRGGFVQQEGFGKVRLKSWTYSTTVELIARAGGCHRLTIRWGGAPMACLDFDCAPEQAAQLRHLLSELRSV